MHLEMDEIYQYVGTTEGIKVLRDKANTTDESTYKHVLDAKDLSDKKIVPTDGRWMICLLSRVHATVMMDDHFIRRGDLSQQMKKEASATGAIAGFAV